MIHLSFANYTIITGMHIIIAHIFKSYLEFIMIDALFFLSKKSGLVMESLRMNF